jgi:hypothetical protein
MKKYRRKLDPNIGSRERKEGRRKGLDKKYVYGQVHYDLTRTGLVPNEWVKREDGESTALEDDPRGRQVYDKTTPYERTPDPRRKAWEEKTVCWKISDGWPHHEPLLATGIRTATRYRHLGYDLGNPDSLYTVGENPVYREAEEAGEAGRLERVECEHSPAETCECSIRNRRLNRFRLVGLLVTEPPVRCEIEPRWRRRLTVKAPTIKRNAMGRPTVEYDGRIIYDQDKPITYTRENCPEDWGAGRARTDPRNDGKESMTPATIVERLSELEAFKLEVQRQLGLVDDEQADDAVEKFLDSIEESDRD